MAFVAALMIRDDVLNKLEPMQQEVQKNGQDPESMLVLAAIGSVVGRELLGAIPEEPPKLTHFTDLLGTQLLDAAVRITQIGPQSVLMELNEQLRVYLYLSGTM